LLDVKQTIRISLGLRVLNALRNLQGYGFLFRDELRRKALPDQFSESDAELVAVLKGRFAYHVKYLHLDDWVRFFMDSARDSH
jgi:hypothetical protein